ncbi:uncharacterized protein PHALS_15045 [Plasmopara halstedii]|uniref:Uncharacterized protein n=1 Tax=Plasmopara halstedii TaxID=4781 RepID=A0A0P1A709_PLAHL|nr:uncharacterized protein PHALS_15045 [Plasmopara halstedii]CEG36183.1 hypothetical protein PHALS_15045 [Plasmopara halstedii]|eukprot:XP_024572552.1 hypothetical protein PHALS_15045 [Plasmopara halstedii]
MLSGQTVIDNMIRERISDPQSGTAAEWSHSPPLQMDAVMCHTYLWICHPKSNKCLRQARSILLG